MRNRLVDLEYELEETRQRIHEAEQDGAEITFRYEQIVAAKDEEIARFQQGPCRNVNEDGECEDCNVLRFELIDRVHAVHLAILVRFHRAKFKTRYRGQRSLLLLHLVAVRRLLVRQKMETVQTTETLDGPVR